MNSAPGTRNQPPLAWWWRRERRYCWRRYLPSPRSSSAIKSATPSPPAKLCPTPSQTLRRSSPSPSCSTESSLFYPVNIPNSLYLNIFVFAFNLSNFVLLAHQSYHALSFSLMPRVEMSAFICCFEIIEFTTNIIFVATNKVTSINNF